MKKTSKAPFILCLLCFVAGCYGKKVVSAEAQARLKSPDAAIRRQAVVELSGSEDRKAVRLLADALNDGDRGVRIEAAAALGKQKAKEATPPLIKAIRDDDIWVRINAAEALGEIGAREAVKPLVALVASVTETTNRASSNWSWAYGKDASAAAFALAKITGKDFGLDTQKWNAWLATENPGSR
jgi:HEAT repeat protein